MTTGFSQISSTSATAFGLRAAPAASRVALTHIGDSPRPSDGIVGLGLNGDQEELEPRPRVAVLRSSQSVPEARFELGEVSLHD